MHNGTLLIPHYVKVVHTRPHILRYCGEMYIGNIPLHTELPYNGGNQRVVHVGYARKQMVLNLVIQSTIEEAK